VATPSHILTCSLWLPRSIEDVFAFFGNAHNLEELTPGFLGFRILTPPPILMAPGTLIDYRISLRGVPIRWRTRIAAWEPPFRFIDEQLQGPYSLWHHEHVFERDQGGTRCADRVSYRSRGGPLVHRLMVAPELLKIFRFRQAALLARMTGAAGPGHEIEPPTIGPPTIGPPTIGRVQNEGSPARG